MNFAAFEDSNKNDFENKKAHAQLPRAVRWSRDTQSSSDVFGFVVFLWVCIVISEVWLITAL